MYLQKNTFRRDTYTKLVKEQDTLSSTLLFGLVLVGGVGERLRPLTNDIPKPLVPVNNVPLLVHHTRMLVRNGVTDIVFLCGYKGVKVKDLFGDGGRFGFRAHYNFEQHPLGRGGAFKAGMSLVPSSCNHVVASNGDVFTDQPLKPMLDLHQKLNAEATAMLVPYPNQYGVVAVDGDGRVTNFAEKKSINAHINAGVYILNCTLKDRLPTNGDHETTTFPALAKSGLLAGFKSNRLWLSVETMKDLRYAEEKLGLISWLGGG